MWIFATHHNTVTNKLNHFECSGNLQIQLSCYFLWYLDQISNWIISSIVPGQHVETLLFCCDLVPFVATHISQTKYLMRPTLSFRRSWFRRRPSWYRTGTGRLNCHASSCGSKRRWPCVRTINNALQWFKTFCWPLTGVELVAVVALVDGLVLKRCN